MTDTSDWLGCVINRMARSRSASRLANQQHNKSLYFAIDRFVLMTCNRDRENRKGLANPAMKKSLRCVSRIDGDAPLKHREGAVQEHPPSDKTSRDVLGRYDKRATLYGLLS
jgi:hypothetical protein